jgi:hypothetical protein
MDGAIEIIPVRVALLNERNLPRSAPSFDPRFLIDRFICPLKCLGIAP